MSASMKYLHACFVTSGDYAMSMNLYMHVSFTNFIILCINLLWVPGSVGYLPYLFSFCLPAYWHYSPEVCYRDTLHELNSVFIISLVNSKPHQSATYLSWSCSLLTFYRAWAALVVMIASILLVEMQSSLSSYTMFLHLASWLCWMEVTSLLSSPHHHLMYYHESYVPLRLL